MTRTTRPLCLTIALSLTAALGACGPIEDDAPDETAQHVSDLQRAPHGSSLHVPAQVFGDRLPESLHLLDALTSAPADPGYGGDGECVMSFELDGRPTDTTLSWAYNTQGLRTHVRLTHEGMTRGITYAYTTDPALDDRVIEVQAETTLPYTDSWRFRPLYNADHQLAEIRRLDISGQPTSESIMIQYDAQDRPARLTNMTQTPLFGLYTQGLGFERQYSANGGISAPHVKLHEWDDLGRRTRSASVQMTYDARGACTMISTDVPLAGQCDAQGRLVSNIDSGRHTRITYDGQQPATIMMQWRYQEHPRTLTMRLSGTRCWMPQHVLAAIVWNQQPVTYDRLDAFRVEIIASLVVEPHLSSF